MCDLCQGIEKASATAESPFGFTPKELISIYKDVAPKDGFEVKEFDDEQAVQIIKWLFTQGFIAILIGHKYNYGNHDINRYIRGPEMAQILGPFPELSTPEVSPASVVNLFNALFPGMGVSEETILKIGKMPYVEALAEVQRIARESGNVDGVTVFPPTSLN